MLHTNDVHAHIEQFNKYGGICEKEQAVKNECFGGVARRQTVIDQLRKENPNNTILLDGGDQFSGTLWFTVYKGEAALTFMNYSKYDAMVYNISNFKHHNYFRNENFFREVYISCFSRPRLRRLFECQNINAFEPQF